MFAIQYRPSMIAAVADLGINLEEPINKQVGTPLQYANALGDTIAIQAIKEAIAAQKKKSSSVVK